jgi:hypothetical protein
MTGDDINRFVKAGADSSYFKLLERIAIGVLVYMGSQVLTELKESRQAITTALAERSAITVRLTNIEQDVDRIHSHVFKTRD